MKSGKKKRGIYFLVFISMLIALAIWKLSTMALSKKIWALIEFAAWLHAQGCRRWFEAERDTVSYAIAETREL